MKSRLMRVVLLGSMLCLNEAAHAIDCNTNGTADATEIAANPAIDCNTNGVPDACDVVVVSYASTNVPLLIPDFNGGSNGVMNSMLSVSGNRTITDVNVQLSIQHTTDNNLGMILTHGTATCTLSYRHGGNGNNYTNTVFDDQASLTISNVSGGAPFSNTYVPETPLSVFNGQSENGTWTLQCLDTAAGNTGTLLAWSLFISAAASNSAIDCNSNGIPDTCELAAHDCNTNGTLDACDAASGANDCNSNTIPDACEGGCNTNNTPDACDLLVPIVQSTTLTNSSAIRIPDNAPADGQGAFRSVTVTSTSLVSDVNVKLNIRHTQDQDLNIYLIHRTTTVALSTNNGAGRNYTNTVFDESAAISITSSAATPPFTGTFRPEGNLNVFNGQSGFGAWTLNVRDVAASNTGTLLNWTLFLQAAIPHDCNTNGTLDECDAAFGGMIDSNTDRILDICQDCDTNGTPDPMETPDCNTNGTPDACELAGHDCNTNAVLDLCEPASDDCNTNLIPDVCEGGMSDCNTSGISDACEVVFPRYTAADTPITIPDSYAPGIASLLTLGSPAMVTDVNVQLSIAHTFDGDLVVTLVHASHSAVLASRRGLGSHNFMNTFFDDSAANPISAGTGPFSGTFRPEQALSIFNGDVAAGTWRLKVADTAALDTGTLLSWTLLLAGPVRDCNTNGLLDDCEPECSADCNTNNLPDICELVSDDCNTNGLLDVCEFGTRPLLLDHYLGTAPTTGNFADANRPQFVADDFTLSASRVIAAVQIIGFFSGSTVPDAALDVFTVKFWSDVSSNGVHIPGTVEYVDVESGTSVVRTYQGPTEIEIALTLSAPATLPAGTHWCEVYYSGTGTATGSGTPQWAWLFTQTSDAAEVVLSTALPEIWAPGVAGHALQFKLLGTASLDCNGNGRPDACDIAANPALDANSNGMLDACENVGCQTCPGDVNGDSRVDAADIAGFVRCFLNVPGPNDLCPCADLYPAGNPDGMLNANDASILINTLLNSSNMGCP